MKKETPILFSTPMVQAILEGRKTMTRRMCKGDTKCRYGASGDLLWVREGFRGEPGDYAYKADCKAPWITAHKWKPSIHLPKAAARIWIEIVSIKTEPVRDISEADAIKEGVEISSAIGYLVYKDCLRPDIWQSSPIDSFKSLWQSINTPESWEANPWVWVIEYKILSTTGKPTI